MAATTITLRQFLEGVLETNGLSPDDVRLVGAGPIDDRQVFMTASWDEFCQPADLINVRVDGRNSARLCLDDSNGRLFVILSNLMVVGDGWFLRTPLESSWGRLSFELVGMPPRTGLPILAGYLQHLIPDVSPDKLITHDPRLHEEGK